VVDTHCHLDSCKPDEAELVRNAAAVGVTRLATVGMNGDSIQNALAAADEYDAVFAIVGRHPHYSEGWGDGDIEPIERAAAHPRVRAIGETGLDYFRDHSPREDQRRAFEAQIGIALDNDLPLVIHVRDREGSSEAVDEVFDTLDRRPRNGTVVLHCFSAPDRVEDAAERGWFCSFAGNVTYPRAENLRAAAARVPDDLLLVETDSPFLAPQPRRGKPNRPAYVVATAAVLAEVRGATREQLERTVEENSARAFAW
jgi:TatD DNase family protein